MVKKLLLFIPIFLLLLIPINASALPLDSVRIYYYNDAGQLLNNGTTISDNWGGSQAFFNNIGFTIGSFQDIPSSVYAFFPSGLGCDNTTCLLQGEIISNESTINTTSYTPLDDVEINVEANGHYTRCSVIGRYRQYDRFTHVTFQCSASNLNNGFNINYSNMGVTAGRYTYFGVVPAAFTITSNLSTQDIIISNNANTNNIINNQNSNTQNIIDNQNTNSQAEIQNANQNTDRTIESQKVCIDYEYGNEHLNTNGYLNETGTISTADNWFYSSDYLEIDKNIDLTISKNYVGGSSAAICLYDINKTILNCSTYISSATSWVINTGNAYYIRFSGRKMSGETTKVTGTYCKNGNQALNDSLNDLNDTLNSESSPNTNQDIEDMEDMLASDTPISDLITMPLTLMHAYINGINSTCSPFNLGTLYGTSLTIPCLNLEQKLGSDLWSKIDVLFSIFMCYNIGMLFITAFSGITSLRDDFDSLYVPKHADNGYQPKHGGGS